MGDWLDGVWSWNLRWRRRLYDWEVEEVGRLEDILIVKTLRRECVDRMSWYNTNIPSFPIKIIVDKLYDDEEPLLLKQMIDRIWCRFYPPRA